MAMIAAHNSLLPFIVSSEELSPHNQAQERRSPTPVHIHKGQFGPYLSVWWLQILCRVKARSITE
jgi:hypothetical protein